MLCRFVLISRESEQSVDVMPAPSFIKLAWLIHSSCYQTYQNTNRPQYALSPANGIRHTARSASRRITTDTQESQAPSNPLDSQNQHTSTTKPQILLPSTSPQDSGPGRGSLFLADIVNVFVSDGQVFEHMQEPTPLMLEEWNEMTLEQKERIYNFMIERWGAVHGQEVVCEAR